MRDGELWLVHKINKNRDRKKKPEFMTTLETLKGLGEKLDPLYILTTIPSGSVTVESSGGSLPFVKLCYP